MIVQEILSGDILKRGVVKRQYKLVLLIAVLIFIYIYSDYRAQRQQHQLNKLQMELQDARYEQLTINAELMELTRCSSIGKALKERGSRVEENNTPVIHIR